MSMSGKIVKAQWIWPRFGLQRWSNRMNGNWHGNYPVDYLDTCTVSVTPDAGWKLVSVVVNDGAVTVNSTSL